MDVVSVVTPLVRGGAQVLHGDQGVELNVLLEVHEKEEEGEDGEGQIEVERREREVNSRRDAHVHGRHDGTQNLSQEVHVTQHHSVTKTTRSQWMLRCCAFCACSCSCHCTCC